MKGKRRSSAVSLAASSVCAGVVYTPLNLSILIGKLGKIQALNSGTIMRRKHGKNLHPRSDSWENDGNVHVLRAHFEPGAVLYGPRSPHLIGPMPFLTYCTTEEPRLRGDRPLAQTRPCISIHSRPGTQIQICLRLQPVLLNIIWLPEYFLSKCWLPVSAVDRYVRLLMNSQNSSSCHIIP